MKQGRKGGGALGRLASDSSSAEDRAPATQSSDSPAAKRSPSAPQKYISPSSSPSNPRRTLHSPTHSARHAPSGSASHLSQSAVASESSLHLDTILPPLLNNALAISHISNRTDSRSSTSLTVDAASPQDGSANKSALTSHRTSMRVLMHPEDAARCSVALGDLVSIAIATEDDHNDANPCRSIGFGVAWLEASVALGREF
jgi:hypothetical protein